MIVDDFMNEEISKDIQVDDSLTSSIIGPRGSRISSVRKKTSAVIKIGTELANPLSRQVFEDTTLELCVN